MQQDELIISTLKTGTEVPQPIVIIVMIQLREWMSSIKGATIVYDLQQMAKDPNYKPFGSNGKDLQDAGFLDGSGRLHKSIADVVHAAVQGTGMDMRLVDPIK